MKCLIIGGNRYVGLRIAHALDQLSDVELHIFNRTGQAAHIKNGVIHKGDRNNFAGSFLDTEWDSVIDFACFNQGEAEATLQYFKKVSRYIFISTASVYDEGANKKEDAYNPTTWDLTKPAEDPSTYQDGKRRAEAVFAQQSRVPVLSVRFPLILGPDDYTHRLDFHIDRVKRSDSIYFPAPKARISMIHAQDAAEFILWSLDKTQLTGPLNVCSADPIALSGMMGQIELITGIKPTLAENEENDNHSPYGVPGDWYMNTEKLRQAGFNPRPIADWLPGLIGTPPKIKPKFVH